MSLQKEPDATELSYAIERKTVYDARQLIPDGTKADIILDGQLYTLRITRAGKLILTK